MTGRPPESPENRFWRKVNKGSEDECWEWVGSRERGGYGQFRAQIIGHDMIKAHRYSYLLYYGELPEGLLVLHSCDNRACVNPKHLRLGTHQDNSDDAKKRGRTSRLTGDLNPMYGRVGKLNPAYGKINGPAKHSEETKQKMSEAQLRRFERERAAKSHV